MVREDTRLMSALAAVRALDLASWCIGAGVLRNLVWDRLQGHAQATPPADIDVAYFDACDAADEADEQVLQRRLQRSHPHLPWEVTNPALVHTWFESHFGHAVAPLRSLEEAVASWPEYATSVGVTLGHDDSLQVIAPHGLDDLFGMRVRRNPARVSPETYRQRVAQKRYAERWPKVRVELFS
jgi:hypothetical protein